MRCEIGSTHQNVYFVLYSLPYLVTNRVLRDLEILPGLASVVHEREEVILHPDQLEEGEGG